MRRIRLLIIGLLSVIGVIFGGSFFKKALSIFLCTLLGFNSISGIPFLSDDSRVNAAFVPTKTESTTIVAPNTLKNPEVIGEIPRIRKAELQLPGDFQLVSQMPFSSGRREIVLVSSSTGVEQVYTTTLAGEENFQLFSIEYKKVAGIDLRPLFVGKNIQGDTTEIESLLKQFKIFFKDSLVSKIVLADGSSVELNGNEAVIKSPKGQVLEKIKLSSNSLSINQTLISQSVSDVKSIQKSQASEVDNFLFAQAKSNSENAINLYLSRVANNLKNFIARFLRENTSSSIASSILQAIESASNFSNQGMQQNINAGNLAKEISKPPVKCNEQVVSGGSEIRTDFFEVSKDKGRKKVILKYNFYEVPDQLEILYDGKIFSKLPPTSGRGSKNLRLPLTAKQVAIRVIGNQDIKTTEWEYTVSCSLLCKQLKPETSDESFQVDEGQLTFDAEGKECPDKNKSCYRLHSRKLHHPTDKSGVTIGRGYDMKTKKSDDIIADLTNAGLTKEEAESYAKGAGKVGEDAAKFVSNNKETLREITADEQKKLFQNSYDWEKSEVQRISNKKDTLAKYGKPDWDNLDPRIEEIVIDLKYRGDYTPELREKIQEYIVKNDFNGFKKAIEDMPNVPNDRQTRRENYLKHEC